MPSDLEFLWVVEGELRTVTPLLIGDGGERPVDKDGIKVRVATAAKMRYENHAVAAIPGTAIKGACLAALRAAEGQQGAGRAFGTMEGGGLIVFGDAPSVSPPSDYSGESWNSEQRVCTRASTAIDPHTGAADEHKLYQFEYVPAGTAFKIGLWGKSYRKPGQSLDELLRRLGPGLAQLGSRTPTLGGALQNGWGAFEWARKPVVKKMPAAALGNWIGLRGRDGTRRSIFEDVRALDGKAIALPDAALRKRITVVVTLQMEGGLLVNDVSRTGRLDDKKPSHAALRNGQKAVIPEKSIRGVLRHQAEKILRTMGGEVRKVEVSEAEDLPGLSGNPSAALFGVPGWRAPFEVTEFRAVNDHEFPPQEFVAIDRFTGGGIEGRKYNAEGARGVKVEGRLRIDPVRLSKAGGGVECLGLLALTLRDLAEGDIAIGWGSARGYGAVKGCGIRIEELPGWGDLPESWQGAVPEAEYQALTGENSGREQKALIGLWVAALAETVRRAR